jgi:uncharacterized membrane protein YdjX (TVP38/TMEM64 family)
MLKWALVAVLVALLIVALWLLFTTASGQKLRNDPRLLARDVRAMVVLHPFIAPAIFLALYIVLGTVSLPVWWLQILVGAVSGLFIGIAWSLIGATLAAVLTVGLSRWLAADWFRTRVEPRMDRLRKLDDLLGHNGFLVVTTVRLIHLLPFSLCNYALGLTKVSMLDVILGTFLGSIPAVAIYVGIGAGYRPWENWKFVAIVAGINVLLLLPLALRYLRPQWFRKIGVE